MLFHGLGDLKLICPFPWHYRCLLRTTSHYNLIGMYDRMRKTVIFVFSRHSGSVYYGLDRRSFFALLNHYSAPHYEKLLIIGATRVSN